MRKLKNLSLADLLNYAHLVEDVLLLKDGGFLVSYQYQAPDLDSASSEDYDALVQIVNRMLLQLNDGWMLHVDEIRMPSTAYSAEGYFPDKVSRLIDAERRQLYLEEGTHFENSCVLTFVWKFPLQIATKTRYLFVSGIEKAKETNLNQLLAVFLEIVERAIGLLQSSLRLKRLTDKELLSFLGFCIEGTLCPITVPPLGAYIDCALARKPLIGGYLPKIGDKFIYVISILGYLNHETIPSLLRELGTYPLVYRWSNRFIPLNADTAEVEIKRVERHWHNKSKGLVGLIKEIFSGQSAKLNGDALQMAAQAAEAQILCANGETRFGYWTSTLILMHEDISILQEANKHISSYIEQVGFSTLLETVNSIDAFRGSIPGHGSCNARRLLVTGFNLAHALPLNNIWCGDSESAPQSLLPKGSPPVFYGVTLGQTPFRFHLDVQDVGHQMVLGPTGAGKSTFLGFLIAQFLRYQDAQIYVFDKDFSHQGLTKALGGYHYNIGEDLFSFCPLKNLDTQSQEVRAQQFIENLVLLQNVSLTPAIRRNIFEGIETLSLDKGQRSLSILVSLIQNDVIREALRYYTTSGQMPLLDASSDDLQTGYLQTFEMNWLLKQKPEVYVPVLLYLFNQIEERLDENNAKCPTLIILEEAWLYLIHPIFVEKIRDWLKTLRKKNARVVFATQSLSDLYDPGTKTLTQVTATLLESCPTKVFLPNLKMDSEARSLYQKMGLNERELEIIGRFSIPKHHYYVMTPNGNRLIHLSINNSPIAQAFIGLSKEKSDRLLSCQKEFADSWLSFWLRENGVNTEEIL